jgi:hypothetical protein
MTMFSVVLCAQDDGMATVVLLDAATDRERSTP